MIQNSKKNLQMGSGNLFLLWGYLCTATALLVYALVTLTRHDYWNYAWFLIPLIGFPCHFWMRRKRTKPVTTYIDKVLRMMWRNVAFGIGSWLVILVIYTLTDKWKLNYISMIIPFSLIMCAAGAMFSGGILKDRWMTISGGAAFIASLPIFISVLSADEATSYLFYALCFVLMMVIPGHRINYKAKEESHV
jgi:hypothetical protein